MNTQIIPTRDEALDLLARVQLYVSNSTEIDDDVRDAVARVMQDHAQQMNVFIVALAKARMARTEKYLTYLDTLEDNMFDAENVRSMDGKGMMFMHRQLMASITNVLQLTQLASTMKFQIAEAESDQRSFADRFMAAHNLNLTGGQPLNKDSRDNVRSVLTGVLQKLGSTDTPYTEVK